MRTSRGAATTRCSPNVSTTGGDTSRPVSCCIPGRWCSKPASRTRRRRWSPCTPATGSRRRPGAFIARCAHVRPIRDRPRPVTLSTWEAVYFDHDHERLIELADVAAAVGVERFVLDDGWFGSGATTRAGSATGSCRPTCIPTDSRPLIGHGSVARDGVRDLGRAGDGQRRQRSGPCPPRLDARHRRLRSGRRPPPARPRPRPDRGVRSCARSTRCAVARPRHQLREVGHEPCARAGLGCRRLRPARIVRRSRCTRCSTRCAARHPDVEFESCASGGGRVDHEILRRTERVWTSDCNDALERQQIQRGASMLIPPELMGAHIGPSRSHTTAPDPLVGVPRRDRAVRSSRRRVGHQPGRRRSARRSAGASSRSTSEHRDLLHGGDVVRFDTGGDAFLAHGVYAADRSRAIVSFVQLDHRAEPHAAAAAPSRPRPRPSLHGRPPAAAGGALGHGDSPNRRGCTVAPERLVLTGRQLAAHGIQPPILHPESAILLTLTAT